MSVNILSIITNGDHIAELLVIITTRTYCLSVIAGEQIAVLLVATAMERVRDIANNK